MVAFLADIGLVLFGMSLAGVTLIAVELVRNARDRREDRDRDARIG